MIGIVIGERDAHHNQRRQDGEYKDAGHRQRHERDLHVAIGDVLQVFDEGRRLAGLSGEHLCLVRAAHGIRPEHKEQYGDEHGGHTIDHQQHRIVTGIVMPITIDLLFGLGAGAERAQHCERRPANRHHVGDIRHFDGQEHQSPGHLLTGQVACAQYQERQSGQGIALGGRRAQRVARRGNVVRLAAAWCAFRCARHGCGFHDWSFFSRSTGGSGMRPSTAR